MKEYSLLFKPGGAHDLSRRTAEFCGAISFPIGSLIQNKPQDNRLPKDRRSSRVFFLLNFDKLEQCSGRSIGYGPTIEAVRAPIGKIVALIIELFLVRSGLGSRF